MNQKWDQGAMVYMIEKIQSVNNVQSVRKKEKNKLLKKKDQLKEQVCNMNLTKALKNIVSCNEFLHTRGPQNDTENRIQSRFYMWLLSKDFTCKSIEILRVPSNQITNALKCLTKYIDGVLERYELIQTFKKEMERGRDTLGGRRDV